MMISKETWVDFEEKYNKVVKLFEEDSRFDPVNDPYRSKYSAKEILIGMKANLQNLLQIYPQDLKVIGMFGAVQLYLGVISIDTEEPSQGEKHLEKCQEIIRDHKNKPEIIMVTLNMFNQFGILWSQRGDQNKSQTYLKEAQDVYESSSKDVYDIKDLFKGNSILEINDPELARHNLEKLHTFTLYYLAQVFGSLGDTVKSSRYCHITLERQYKSGDFDPIDWALNAATLSQFFMEKDLFKMARNHLAASSLILAQYKRDLDAITERTEAVDAKIEEFHHRSADVARCWAKYGLVLLSKSKERLMTKSEDEPTEASTESPDDDCDDLMFDLDNIREFEAQVTSDMILTFHDSREVFINVKSWLDKAEMYYTLNNLASDFVEIEQDRSQLYCSLAFFEDSPENQAKLHKRRTDILDSLVGKLNPKFYMKACREIWFELGQTYAEILNIKSDKLRESEERPQPHVLAKINHLIAKSLNNYQNFVKSFAKDNGKISEDFEKPYLQALFYTAALSSRYITLDKKIQLANTEISYKAYKEVLDYCEKKFEADKMIPMEFGICKEMVALLPMKIAKLKQEIDSST